VKRIPSKCPLPRRFKRPSRCRPIAISSQRRLVAAGRKETTYPLTKLPRRGTYSLIISVLDEVRANVGRLGEKVFPRGYYAYTGSALGKGGTSLANRLSRHLRAQKRKRWHIDYLLAQKNVELEAAVVVCSRERLECKFNKLIKTRMEATTPILGFGASDCKACCESHLLRFPHMTEGEVVVERMVSLASEISKASSIRAFRVQRLMA